MASLPIQRTLIHLGGTHSLRGAQCPRPSRRAALGHKAYNKALSTIFPRGYGAQPSRYPLRERAGETEGRGPEVTYNDGSLCLTPPGQPRVSSTADQARTQHVTQHVSIEGGAREWRLRPQSLAPRACSEGQRPGPVAMPTVSPTTARTRLSDAQLRGTRWGGASLPSESPALW